MIIVISPCFLIVIGEPPLFLGCSVYYAIKEAIYAAKSHNLSEGCEKFFRMDSPATVERIRMSCSDNFTSRFVRDENFLPRGSW